MDIEEFDQRPHEEGRDDGAYADDGGHLGPGAAADQEDGGSQQDADQVGSDADVLELAELPFVRESDGHGIIGGNAQIGGHIQGAADTDDHDADHEEENAEQDGGPRDQPVEGFQGELGDIAQQEQIDKGRDADVMPVEDQAEQKQHGVDDDIQRSEGNGNQPVQTAHQALEGIHPKGGLFEKAHRDGADDHPAQGHGHSSSVDFQFLFPPL